MRAGPSPAIFSIWTCATTTPICRRRTASSSPAIPMPPPGDAIDPVTNPDKITALITVWLEVRVSRAHHAVVCYRRFPESERKAPNWRGSVRRFVLRDGIVTVGRSFLRIFLWPRNPVSRKRRPREAEIWLSVLSRDVAFGMKRTRHQLAPAMPGQKIIDRAVAELRAQCPFRRPP